MPFDLEICTDMNAKFPPITINETSKSANVSEEKEDEDEVLDKTIVLKVQTKDSTVTYMTIYDYVIEIKPNGQYTKTLSTKSGTRYSSAEPYEWRTDYNPEVTTGAWEICDYIQIGNKYPKFYCLKRSEYQDMYVTGDLKYIWWGETSYFDAEAYNLNKAARISSVSYK